MATGIPQFKKKQKIRTNEYYDMQTEQDNLYKKSKEVKIFKDLIPIITSEQNIALAYRNIKKNKGSKTSGVNKATIYEIGETSPEVLVKYVRNRLLDYKPQQIRRVEIDKENGGKRPLGIPTIEDRIIQQCIKQVLEPICEAKFHKHSYGFRPNRGTHHAIARAMFLANRAFHYVVDIDIKGFFDNVNHSKLLKQIWTMGIQDKNLICILSKMLKAEIKGIGKSEKGTPQGGILSPLLSNIVLNELDWWISSQWESYKTRKEYKGYGSKYKLMREKSKLKEVFIVRYCDDFKLFCKNRADAKKLYEATKAWLKERLGLEVNEEKSKIVSLKQNYSEFLGIKIKVWNKGKKWVVKSSLKVKSKDKVKRVLKEKIQALIKTPSIENVNKYNATVLGIHNYYKVATNVSRDFHKIAYELRRTLKYGTKHVKSKIGLKNRAYEKYYGEYRGKIIYISGIALFPIGKIRTDPPMCFSQTINNYTEEGRQKIHNKLISIDKGILNYLMRNPVKSRGTEYNDNRISLYVGQQGKCAITKELLEINSMEVHHKTPRNKYGTDKYTNLIFIKTEVHYLIHATDENIIKKYLDLLKGIKIDFEKLNKLRVLVGNCELCENK